MCGKRYDWFFPKTYSLSPQDLVDAFQTIEEEDSPNNPGWIKVRSLKSALARFRLALSIHVAEEWENRPESFLSERGSLEEMIEWNRPEVLRLFEAPLNIYERIFFVLEPNYFSTGVGRLVPVATLGVIVLSVVSWVVSTLDSLQSPPSDCVASLEIGNCEPKPLRIFAGIEVICLFFFCVEYGLRLVTCHSVRFLTFPVSAIIRLMVSDDPVEPATTRRNVYAFATSFQYCIDLLAVLPQLISYCLPSGSQVGNQDVAEVLRMFRAVRVFKIASYNETFVLLARVLVTSFASLVLILICVLIGLVLFGSLIWYIESGSWYPKGHPLLVGMGLTTRGAYVRQDSSILGYEISPFTSIPTAFWYVIATMTTVGYGDVVPTTNAGKTVGTVCMLAGILSMALPIGVIGSSFSAELTKMARRKERFEVMQRKHNQSRLLRQSRAARSTLTDGSDDISRSIEEVRSLLSTLARDKPGLAAFASQFDLQLKRVTNLGKIEGHEIDQIIFSAFNAFTMNLAGENGQLSAPSVDARRVVLKMVSAMLGQANN